MWVSHRGRQKKIDKTLLRAIEISKQNLLAENLKDPVTVNDNSVE